MNEATIVENKIHIQRHSVTGELHWLEIQVTDWDDVKKLNRKILKFEGREYGWSCWNSDRMVSVFRSPPFNGFASIKS